MSSTDLLKRRLTSLKSLTQQIKNSTTDSPINIGHLKQLIQQTKHYYYDQKASSDSLDIQNSHTQIRRKKQYQPLFAQTEYDETRVFDKNNASEQMAHLREENIKLQHELEAMKEKIYELEVKIDKSEEQLRKQPVPYFKISNSLSLFVCRMRIDTRDYNKVEYLEYEVELSLDKLLLTRRQKMLRQEFALMSLCDVKYEGEAVLVLQFQEQPTNLTTIFLKFASKEQLRKWDLALYTNFQMIQSLDRPALFEPYFRRIKQQQARYQELQQLSLLQRSQSINKNHESYLLNLLLKRKEDYLQIQKLINQKLHHKIKIGEAMRSSIEEQEEEQDRKRERKKRTKQKEKTKIQYRANEKQQLPVDSVQKVETIPQNIQNTKLSTVKNDEVESFLDTSGFRPSVIPTNPIANKRTSEIFEQNMRITPPAQKNQGQFRLNPPPFDFLPASQKIQGKTNGDPHQSLKISIVNQFANVQGYNRAFEQQSPEDVNKKYRQTQKRLAQAIQNLQSGYFAIKYSKDGFNPHPKKVFLSLDCKKLCWSEPEKQTDYKSVPLDVVKKVTYPELGEGILKHIKNPDAKHFCVIQYLTGNYNKKTIQLGSGNVEDINNFYQDFHMVRQNNIRNSVQM